jgi:hypothetical protein
MQMIEVRVRHQDQVNRREVTHPQSGTPQALEHEKPAGKIGIDDNVLPAHLYKKTGVADESYAQFAVRDQMGLMGLSATRSHCRMPHKAPEL